MDSFWEDYGSPSYNGSPLDLSVDEAIIQIDSDNDGASLFKSSSLCVGCPYTRVEEFSTPDNMSLKISSKASWSFLFSPSSEKYHFDNVSEETLCSITDVSIGQFGVYELQLRNNSCEISTLKSPVFSYGALIIALCASVLLLVGTKIFNFFYVKHPHLLCMPCCSCASSDTKSVDGVATSSRPRLKSLDTFRGITIFLMIFVNHGAGQYWFFEHAPWDGLYVADVIFPWFMWIMGVCIPMGLSSQVRKANSNITIIRRIIIRSMKLFAIGIVLNSIGGYFQFETYRIPGVLQRFAISYLVTSLIYLCFVRSINDKIKNEPAGYFSYLTVLIPQIVIYSLITVCYLLFIFLVPVPGCPTGYFGPGGISNFMNGQPTPDCIGGITRLVDIKILGNSHIYQNPTAKFIYESSSFDPEGILGTVPTLVQVFLGIIAGQVLASYKGHKERIRSWGGVTLMTAFLGLIFWLAYIPVNKNLWSVSYVFFTSSLAFMLLILCYVIIDVFHIWDGSPFYQTGMNSIALYVGHFFTFFAFPWHYSYGKMNTHMALLLECYIGTALWIIIALYLHKKNKFYTL